MQQAITNSQALILPSPPANTVATNAAATNDIRAIRAPVEIPGELTWLWWTLAGVALAALLIWLGVWLWRRRAAQIAAAAAVPPHVRARRRLQEALALIDQPKPFCIEVSDAVRVYLEERFEFHAPERTTEEFLVELQATSLLASQQKQSLADFLSRCDLAKFARYEPVRPELEDLHNSAVRLVKETEPRPVPADAPPQPVAAS
jgi:hypothetical protein